MSNSRPLINPLHNLIQTAYHLAKYLRKIKREACIEVLKQAKTDYEILIKWSKYFYTVDSVDILTKMMNEITQDNILEKMLDKLQEGGWT